MVIFSYELEFVGSSSCKEHIELDVKIHEHIFGKILGILGNKIMFNNC